MLYSIIEIKPFLISIFIKGSDYCGVVNDYTTTLNKLIDLTYKKIKTAKNH